jgi:hypothetical protein
MDILIHHLVQLLDALDLIVFNDVRQASEDVITVLHCIHSSNPILPFDISVCRSAGMDSNGVVEAFGRRSRAEAARLVSEFEQSGLRRKEFCAARGLSVHTLDVWRRRIAQPGLHEEIVPVEIVADRAVSAPAMPAAGVAENGQFRVVLAQGIWIEVEPGFDAAELRRLVAALYGVATCPSLSRPV